MIQGMSIVLICTNPHIGAREEVLAARREWTVLCGHGTGLEKRYHSLLEFIKGNCVCLFAFCLMRNKRLAPVGRQGGGQAKIAVFGLADMPERGLAQDAIQDFCPVTASAKCAFRSGYTHI
jgi:hypothetical protein